MTNPPLILALDLADHAGWCFWRNGLPVSLGTLTAPDKLDPLYKRMWIAHRVMGMIRTIQVDPDSPHDVPLWVAYEGTFLAEYSAKGRYGQPLERKRKAVDTKEYLDRLGGAIEHVCYAEDALPVLVPLHKIAEHLHIPSNTARFARKQASLRFARLMLMETLPNHAAAILDALEHIENWHGGNRDGETKNPDTVLAQADRLMSKLDFDGNSCDALVIGEVARGLIHERELAKGEGV